MPLSDDPKNVLVQGGSGENEEEEVFRLTKAFHPESSLVVDQNGTVPIAHAVWQVDYHERGSKLDSDVDPISEFVAIYQFSEEEFTRADFAVHHYMLMNKPSADIFSDDIVAARYVTLEPAAKNRDDNSDDVLELPIEKRTMFRGVVKRRKLGAREELETIKLTSEAHRVECLRKYFDIMVEEGDIEHIKNRSSALDRVQPIPDGFEG